MTFEVCICRQAAAIPGAQEMSPAAVMTGTKSGRGLGSPWGGMVGLGDPHE
jgi:hypothetical protein